jgi:hypothetical protein
MSNGNGGAGATGRPDQRPCGDAEGLSATMRQRSLIRDRLGTQPVAHESGTAGYSGASSPGTSVPGSVQPGKHWHLTQGQRRPGGRLPAPAASPTKKEEPAMYIGLGTLVLIVIIILVIMMLRRR